MDYVVLSSLNILYTIEVRYQKKKKQIIEKKTLFLVGVEYK